MKVLHVTPSYYPATSFGGPIKSVHLLNKYLIKKGVEVDVLTTNAGLEKDNIKLERWELLDGVRVKFFPYRGYVHYNFSRSLFKNLLKDVKNYDLVHITALWNFPVLASSFACKKNNIPYIISPRGTIYPETIALKSATVKQIYLKIFGFYCLNNASAIHFTSEDEQSKVMEYLKIKTSSKVIYNGIEINYNGNTHDIEQTSLIFRKNKYILFIGRMNKKKGLDLLLQAFSNIRKTNTDIKLIIAGPDNDNYKKDLLEIVKNYGMNDRVIFTGMLTGRAKEEAYSNALMFVLPSYSENFGMTVAEAMLHKTPVIVSDKVGIYPLIERYGAGIVVSPEVDQLVDAIENLLFNVDLKETLRSNATKLLNKEFNIDNVTDQFIDFYNSVIELK